MRRPRSAAPHRPPSGGKRASAPPRGAPLTIYVAGSFRHRHGVRLFGRELAALGCHVLDWTEKAVPPPGLTPAERRLWMDTDQAGGTVFAFCRDACLKADLVIYYGASGQDAGLEVGLAAGSGVPVLGIRGPLEGPGLMLHGAATAWVDTVEDALVLVERLISLIANHAANTAANDGTRDGAAAAAKDMARNARRRHMAAALRTLARDLVQPRGTSKEQAGLKKSGRIKPGRPVRRRGLRKAANGGISTF